MDRGEFAKSELTITPAANGSYLVRRNWHRDREQYLPNPIAEMSCFSNYADLLNFLCREYLAANKGADNVKASEGEGE